MQVAAALFDLALRGVLAAAATRPNAAVGALAALAAAEEAAVPGVALGAAVRLATATAAPSRFLQLHAFPSVLHGRKGPTNSEIFLLSAASQPTLPCATKCTACRPVRWRAC